MDGREAFEAAAKARNLNLARDPEWVRIGGAQESERPYYNGRTNAAWWAWRESLAAERERCAAAVRAVPPHRWVDGSDQCGRPCPAKVVATKEDYVAAILGA